MNSLKVNEVNVKAGGLNEVKGLAPGNLPPFNTIYIYRFKKVLKFVHEFFLSKYSSISSNLSSVRLFLFFLKGNMKPMKHNIKPMKHNIKPMEHNIKPMLATT